MSNICYKITIIYCGSGVIKTNDNRIVIIGILYDNRRFPSFKR